MDFTITDTTDGLWGYVTRKRVALPSGRIVGVMQYYVPPKRPSRPATDGCMSMHDLSSRVYKTEQPFWHDGYSRCRAGTPEECAALMVSRWRKRNKGKPARVVPEADLL